MKEWLVFLTEHAVTVMDAMALLVIAYGTVQAFVGAVRFAMKPGGTDARRAIWMRYGHWLVAGLTFQLAADIVETSITTSWDAIGRIGAIAVIRTFLNYFLERDIAEVRRAESKGG
jgi:uncharacterized membrane protein